MVSIIILALAILPMAGMFDMGLEAATAGSNYDKARALANLKLEEAKSLPFDAAVRKDNFPEAAGPRPPTRLWHYDQTWMTVTGPASADFTNFKYRVEKQYMTQPPTRLSSSSGFEHERHGHQV